MKKFVKYCRECYDELKNKVSWPTWKELQNSAVVVSIASLIIAVIVFLMDTVFSTVMETLYKVF